MWPFRRKHRPREREIGEAEAYHLLHGERTHEVKIVAVRAAPSLPSRRRGHFVTVEGESLRAAFERKLAERRDRRDKPSSA
jgi:hypothetical protein